MKYKIPTVPVPYLEMAEEKCSSCDVKNLFPRFSLVEYVSPLYKLTTNQS